MSGSSLDGRMRGEAFLYGSWFHDPELVENLVDLLEAKTRRRVDGPEVWKFSYGEIFNIFFQDQDYTRAPLPKNVQAFRNTVAQLRRGDPSDNRRSNKKFGRKIPDTIKDRFFEVTRLRGGIEATKGTEKIAFWTPDRKIIAAGLVDYCGLRMTDASALFGERLGRRFGEETISDWRVKKEYPYWEKDRLTINTPFEKVFISRLHDTFHMTLEEVKKWIQENMPATDAPHSTTKSRLKDLQHFMDRHPGA